MRDRRKDPGPQSGTKRPAEAAAGAGAPVRAFWSGTLSFGLVTIPVDLFAAARGRRTSMKLVDAEGHALGRRYFCPEHDRALGNEEIVRAYEAEDGTLIVISDEEFDSAAPELSRDIELRRFVPVHDIPAGYFQRPYWLAPDPRAGKAYSLLAQTMERLQRAAIGSFVMRGREYLVAILAEGGVLRAETLRFADELRDPQAMGILRPGDGDAKQVKVLGEAIDALTESTLDLEGFEDREAEALQALARKKLKAGKDVIGLSALEDDDADAGGGAEVIDLMQLLRKSLGGEAPASPGAAKAVATPSDEKPATPAATSARTTAHAPPRKAARRATARLAQDDGLADASKADLQKLAAELDVPGRSKLDKDALLKAVRSARRAA